MGNFLLKNLLNLLISHIFMAILMGNTLIP